MGKSFLAQHGIGPAEFQVLRSWSGWASMSVANREDPPGETAATPQDNVPGPDKVEEHADSGELLPEHQASSAPAAVLVRPSSISKEQMLRVGGRVKCVLDYGRLQYMRGVLGCRVGVYTEYCAAALTPECRVLIGCM